MVLKCKMCGGDLELAGGEKVVECEYCGTSQTVPSADNEKKANLFNRANRLRMSAEFDKAAGVYESIAAEFPEEAEAYWGLCLCAYGIEYVDDPATGKKIPTCHRTRTESIMDCANFEMACEYADAVARSVYRSEAKEIQRLQSEIHAIVASESPYDVFICYKETGEDGERTEDSVIAQDIYDALTAKGLKVFFARITLEDKLGREYEPYIYAALHSAKVMLAIGTKYEHYDAVWVKNEWSRFLEMMKEDRTKVLVPCFKGLDAYDIPKEMRSLQAQDLGKPGFLQDLVRGVEKIVGKTPAAQESAPQAVQQTVIPQQGAGVKSLMRRAQLYLEDEDWKNADSYLDKVLDIDPEYAPAYFGKVMARWGVRREEEFGTSDRTRNCEYAHRDKNWEKALRFASPELRERYEGYRKQTEQRMREKVEADRIQKIYDAAHELFEHAVTPAGYEKVKEALKPIEQDPRAQELSRECDGRIETYLSTRYDEAAAKMRRAGSSELFRLAREAFASLGGYRDSEAQAKACEEKRQEYEAKEREALRIQREKEEREKEEERVCREREQQIKKEKRKKQSILTAVIILAAAAVIAAYVLVIGPMMSYKKAEDLLAQGMYAEASAAFIKAGTYSDAAERVNEPYYVQAESLLAQGLYAEASAAFVKAGTYSDAAERVNEPYYVQTESLLAQGLYAEASAAFVKAGTYSDAAERVNEPYYVQAESLIAEGKPLEAALAYRKSGRPEGLQLANDLLPTGKLFAGWYHTVGLRADGIVVAEGRNFEDQCDVGDWRDIVAVSAGKGHTVGLRAGGTVVAAGRNVEGQCEVSDWRDIVSVSAGRSHTIGLRADGTVVAAGKNNEGQCEVSCWSNIVAVSAGGYHTVGLRADGTVVAVGRNSSGQCEMSGWSDIVAVSAGGSHTVGLRADGTVVAAGRNNEGQCEVSGWSNIVAVSASSYHTVGLRADGTAVAVGSKDESQCEVSGWSDIVAVSAGYHRTVGLRSDGAVVAVGNNSEGQCNVSDWDLW